MAKTDVYNRYAPTLDMNSLCESGRKGRQCDEDTPLLPSATRSPGCCGLRHHLVALAFLGCALGFGMRVNLTIALVAMVNSTVNQQPLDDLDDIHSHSSPVISCPVPLTNLTVADTPRNQGTFNWDSDVQGLILSSFFWGYAATQIPGGILAKKYGGKPLMGVSILLTAIFAVLSPLAAWTGPGYLIATRVGQGLGQGMLFPAAHSLLSKWSAPMERSRFVSIVYSGGQFGTVVALPLSGWLAETSFWGGWPAIFYVPGIAGVVWFCFWMSLVHENPEDHPEMTELERSYVTGGGSQPSQSSLRIPWRQIWTSLPMWAILSAHIGQNWGFNTLLTELPIYMKNILNFDIQQNSLLSTVPHLTMALLSSFSGCVADLILRRGYLSVTTTRKVMNTCSHWLPAICLVSACFAGCDRVSSVALLTLAVGFNGFCRSGFQSNHLDISPNYAGIIMGITNCAANIITIMAPILVGHLTTGAAQNLDQWRIVFYVCAGIYFVTNSFYLMFGTAKEQEWNNSDGDKELFSSTIVILDDSSSSDHEKEARQLL